MRSILAWCDKKQLRLLPDGANPVEALAERTIIETALNATRPSMAGTDRESLPKKARCEILTDVTVPMISDKHARPGHHVFGEPRYDEWATS